MIEDANSIMVGGQYMQGTPDAETYKGQRFVLIPQHIFKTSDPKDFLDCCTASVLCPDRLPHLESTSQYVTYWNCCTGELDEEGGRQNLGSEPTA